MNVRDQGLLAKAANDNRRSVILYVIAELAFIGLSLGFSISIAAYFGHEITPRLGEGWEGRNGTIVIALALATAALVARVTQNYIEAYTLADRERWFAERIRASQLLRSLPGNIARASNHYGRFAAAGMKAVSTLCVLTISAVALILLLPSRYALAGLVVLALALGALYLLMARLSRVIEDAAGALARHAKAASAWKADPSTSATPEVGLYFEAYRRRVFYVSTFGLTGLLFAVLFCVLVIVAREFANVQMNFGEAFVTFVVLQAYLALIGRLFGSLVQGSAFLPAVRPYLDPAAGDEAAPADFGGADFEDGTT